MKILAKAAIVFSLILHISSPSNISAEDIAVIANSGFPKDKVTLHYLRKVYLGQKVEEGGIKIVPLDNQKNNPVKRDFIGKVLSSTIGKYKAHWLKQIFREGKTPPKGVRNFQSMMNTTRKTRGAIGYLYVKDLKDQQGIKILHLIK